ncbi:MAG: hypothetical protein H6572_07875 [Lewinellaceae bacterium]|nr:hypothetical protein [Lewinellaceae bacterium]
MKSESQIKRITRMTQKHISLSGGGARRAGEEKSVQSSNPCQSAIQTIFRITD